MTMGQREYQRTVQRAKLFGSAPMWAFDETLLFIASPDMALVRQRLPEFDLNKNDNRCLVDMSAVFIEAVISASSDGLNLGECLLAGLRSGVVRAWGVLDGSGLPQLIPVEHWAWLQWSSVEGAGCVASRTGLREPVEGMWTQIQFVGASVQSAYPHLSDDGLPVLVCSMAGSQLANDSPGPVAQVAQPGAALGSVVKAVKLTSSELAEKRKQLMALHEQGAKNGNSSEFFTKAQTLEWASMNGVSGSVALRWRGEISSDYKLVRGGALPNGGKTISNGGKTIS